MEMEHSCVMGGSAKQVAFVSNDSNYKQFQNFVGSDVVSTHCPSDQDGRLAMEQPEFRCYHGDANICRRSCAPLGDLVTCMADLREVATGRQANATAGAAGANATSTAAGANATATTAATANATGATMTPAAGTTTPSTGATTMAPGPILSAPNTTESTDPAGVNGTTTTPAGENATDTTIDVSESTLAPTDSEPDAVTIIVAFLVRNNMMITDPEEIRANGLDAAWPVYVEEVVASLSTSVRRKLEERQRRRLEITLVPNSAEIYDVFSTGCVDSRPMEGLNSTNSTSGTNSTESMTFCHNAMGRYDLLLTPDEDPIAVKSTYTAATRSGIDDGTFGQVLLRVEPNSSLLVGPSVEPNIPDTDAPTNVTDGGYYPDQSGPPSPLSPSCAPASKSSKGSKGSKSKASSKGGNSKGMKMMRRNMHRAMEVSPGYRRNRNRRQRKLDGHLAAEPEFTSELTDEEIATDTVDFANVLKQHDEGGYYSAAEHEEEEELYEDGDADADECVDPPGQPARSGSSKGSSKGKRTLRETLPRIHGAHHETHHINDMHRMLAEELKSESDEAAI